MRLLIAKAGATLLFLAATTIVSAAPVETLPVSQIQPGMTGEGLTVFSGSQVDKFRVEVLGVLRNYGPQQNLILAKLEGGPLADTGVIAGMSGSPVYIDGKLVGAVAFSFPFSKEPIAGITPIGEMIDATATPAVRKPAARLSFPLTPEKLEALVSGRRAEIPVQNTALAAIDSLKPFLGKLLTPIATPAALRGFSPEVFELIAPLLRKVGIEPLMGGAMAPAVQASTGEGSPGDEERPVEPGDAIGVGLVTGDLDINAVGTVTHVDPLTKSVYAFGHPFFNLGPIEYPMTRAEVHLVLPSLYSSFKMASTGAIVGTWLQDRTTAVKGVMGPQPGMIPLSVDIHTSRGQEKSFHVRLVHDELFSPVLVYASLASMLQSTERDFGNQTVELSARVYMDEEPPVIIEDIFTDQQPALAASAMVAAPMSFLMANDFQKVHVKEVRVEIEASETLKTARLVRAWLERDQTAPGGSVPLKLLLQSYRGEEMLETVNVAVPANAPEGELNLVIADANTMSAMERRLIQARFEPRSLGQLIRALNGLRRNNRLYIRLNRPGQGGAIVAGEYLSSLPPSVLNVLEADQSSGNFIPVPTSTLWEYELVTDYSVSGSRALELTVKNP